MGLKFSSIASGSSGNCYLVMTDRARILVDVGIAGKRVIAGVESAGLSIEDIDGICITHEHSDHIKSLRMIGKKACKAKVFATKKTVAGHREKLPEGRCHLWGDVVESVMLGDIEIIPFGLSHDTEQPIGYAFQSGGKKITIITDTGCITDEIYRTARNSDLLVLEANHEVNLLRLGPYPFSLQQRILSDYGHLSNDLAGDFLAEILKYRENKGGYGKLKVALAHLSKENNTREHALLTVKNRIAEDGFEADKDVELAVLSRDEVSPLVLV